MAIPAFTSAGVLPPFLGSSPGILADQSPYHATLTELVTRFGTTADRNRLLRGLISLRQALHGHGIVEGFQWIDGSFVEDKEMSLGKSPGDIDIVTVFRRPAGVQWSSIKGNLLLNLLDPGYCKSKFSCEAFYIDADAGPIEVALQSSFWFGLFSHQRTTYLWKGAVALQLNPVLGDDQNAGAELDRRGF